MATRLIIDENSVYEIDEDCRSDRGMNHAFMSQEKRYSGNGLFFMQNKGSRKEVVKDAEKGDG